MELEEVAALWAEKMQQLHKFGVCLGQAALLGQEKPGNIAVDIVKN